MQQCFHQSWACRAPLPAPPCKTKEFLFLLNFLHKGRGNELQKVLSSHHLCQKALYKLKDNPHPHLLTYFCSVGHCLYLYLLKLLLRTGNTVKSNDKAVCVSFPYLENCPSNQLHTSQVYCWGRRDVNCQI